MTVRGTSTALGYVLTLAIATLLVAGLILAGGAFVQEHREQVIRQELRVVGEHLASNAEQVDRYAGAAETVERARVAQRMPATVTGSAYSVTLTDGSPPELHLNATRPRVSVVVEVTIEDADSVVESHANGGSIAVFCGGTPSSCDLEMENV